MAINPDVTITPLSGNILLVNWTAPGTDYVSWMFVNGNYSVGPMYLTGTERSVQIPAPSSESIVIEIHDKVDDSETVQPTIVAPITRPVLTWLAVDDAVTYRIYHSVDGAPDALVFTKDHDGDLDRYYVRFPFGMDGVGGVWHSIRVESVDEFGNTSARENWQYFVMDLPVEPDTVTVVDGSAPGLYDISIP